MTVIRAVPDFLGPHLECQRDFHILLLVLEFHPVNDRPLRCWGALEIRYAPPVVEDVDPGPNSIRFGEQASKMKPYPKWA